MSESRQRTEVDVDGQCHGGSAGVFNTPRAGKDDRAGIAGLTRPSPRSAIVYRWLVGIGGLLALAALAPALRWDVSLGVLVAAVVLTEILLLIPVDRGTRSYISLASVFVFSAFLGFGAIAAAAIHVLALVIGALIPWRATEAMTPRTLRFLVFNGGQLALSAILSGVVVWVVYRVPLDGRGDDQPASIVLFALTYFLVNSTLVSGAVWLQLGSTVVRDRFWTETTRWTALSLVVTTPLALIVEALAERIGFLLSVALIFASLVAVGRMIDLNLRLRERNLALARATAELRTLNAVGQALSATLDLDALFEELARQVQRVVPADAFMVALVDRESGVLRFPFQIHGGVRQPAREEPLDEGQGIVGRVVRAGAPIVDGDIESFALRTERGEAIAGDTMRDRWFASALAVPIRAGPETIGALCVKSHERDVYGSGRIDLLVTVAAQASVAIHNAHLFAAERAAVQAKQDFLSVVSHELRTPITSITGYSQLLKRRLVREHAAGTGVPGGPHLEMVEVIEEQTRVLGRLVDDLLELSRLQGGRLSFVMETVNLAEIARDAVGGLPPDRSGAPPRISLNVPAVVPVRGDEVRLQQVFDNLLSNALKYSPPGSPVTVTVEGRDGSVDVAVVDHGAGIPPEEQTRIFEPFTRAGRSDAGDRGLGLGLSICREIVAAHGGNIWVESRQGQGSVFRFRLPLIASSEPESDAHAGDPDVAPTMQRPPARLTDGPERADGERSSASADARSCPPQ